MSSFLNTVIGRPLALMLRRTARAICRADTQSHLLTLTCHTKPSLHRFITSVPQPPKSSNGASGSNARSSAHTRKSDTHPKPSKNPKYKRSPSTQAAKVIKAPGHRFKRLLEPHILSQRLKRLCDGGQLEVAIDMLKNAPLDAQNTPVWNTLIWEALKAGRWNLSYKLYTDMKRRGLSPTTRTYQTMFTGLSHVDHWPTHSLQLNHAHQLYDYFLKHLQAVKFHTPDSDELTISPLGKYIKILGDAGDFQRIFNIYYAMDSEGPLSPNQDVFTAMFQVLSARRRTDGYESAISHNQNGSTARLLWTQMEKASKKSPGFAIDSHLIAMAIRALTEGRPSDHDFALDIVRDQLGLVRPGEAPVNFANTELSVYTLAATLESCNNMQRPELCIHYLQQVMHPRYTSPQGTRSRVHVDRGHIEQGLKAHVTLALSGVPGQSIQAVETLQWMLRSEIAQSNVKLRPQSTTFNLVLSACRVQGDWEGATRTFHLISGYQPEDFGDSEASKKAKPVMEVRSKGRNLAPDAEVMSSMVRTALASKIPANIRQSLRMVDRFDVDHLLSAQRIGADSLPQPKKVTKLQAFLHEKLAVAVDEAVNSLTRTKGSRELRADEDKEMARWRHLQARAKAFLRDKESVKIRRVQAASAQSGRKYVVVEESALPSSQQPSHNHPQELLVSDTELSFLYDQPARRHAKARPIVRS